MIVRPVAMVFCLACEKIVPIVCQPCDVTDNLPWFMFAGDPRCNPGLEQYVALAYRAGVAVQ